MDFMTIVVKALEQNENYDYYQEFEKCFVFSCSEEHDLTDEKVLPTLVDKSSGQIISYAERKSPEYSGWLDSLVAEGFIADRLYEDCPTSPTHHSRYMFEHKVIPDLFYQNGLGFIAAIVEKNNILNKVFLEILSDNEIENIYGDEPIKVNLFKIENILVAKIVFPKPEEEPLCYEAYALFDTENDRAGYYCLEAGEDVDREHFLCGWTREGVHTNYGKCSSNQEELILNILKLFVGYKGDDKPTLEATYDPRDGKVKKNKDPQ